MASKKKTRNKAKKAAFTPEELKFHKRFLASAPGKWLLTLSAMALVLVLAALIAADDLNLFFLLTGISLLAFIITFWVLLLYKRATSRE